MRGTAVPWRTAPGFETVGIAPGFVEEAIAESEHLGEEIEPDMEEEVEPREPDIGDRQRELEETLHDGEGLAGAHRARRVVE